MLNLETIPRRKYDPKNIAYNATSQAKLTRFDHEEDIFDDLFSLAKLFFQIKGLIAAKLGTQGLEKFNRLRAQRLETLPLDLLATTSTVQPKGQSEQDTPKVKKVHEKEKTLEQDQRQELGSGPLDSDIYVDPKLIKEWKQFDSFISNIENILGFATLEVSTGQKTTVNTVPIEGTSSPPKIHKDTEIIPEHPFDEIVLHVEEIPLLDIFYSPKHRVVVKRQRKKRKIDHSPLLTSQVEMMNVVWREEVSPFDDLTKLSQYARAYTATTMDKALEVSNLLKEKFKRPSSQSARVIVIGKTTKDRTTRTTVSNTETT